MAISDGALYELRSMLNNNYAVDVANGSATNGADIRTWTANGTNAQKFWVQANSDGTFTFINYRTNKVLDVKNGTAARGQNIQQYQSNNSAAQKWRVVNVATTTINGISCDVVNLISSLTTANTWYVDTNENKDLKNNSLVLYSAGGNWQNQLSQRWAFLPTDAISPDMPTPYNISLAKSVGESGSINASAGATLYPRLQYPSTFKFGQENNAIEWRIRTSYMNSNSASWGAWSEYSEWTTDGVTDRNGVAYLTGIATNYSFANYKNMRVEIQARCQSVLNGHTVHGGNATQICYATLAPTITLSNATMSPAGLTLNYTSNYTWGTNRLEINSITRQGTELLKDSFLGTGDDSTSITVPMELLTEFIASGTSVKIKYKVGNDQQPTFAEAKTQTLSVAWQFNSGAAPSVVVDSDAMLLVLTPSLETSRVWVDYGNSILELDANDGIYSVPFPMAEQFTLWCLTSSNDGDTWSIWNNSYEIGEGLLAGFKPCHAWTTPTSAIALELNLNAPLYAEYNVQAISETNVLDARPFETVSFAQTKKAVFQAKGVIPAPYTDKKSVFEELVGTHAIYRSPLGDMFNVAITKVDFSENRWRTEVSVSMTREG